MLTLEDYKAVYNTAKRDRKNFNIRDYYTPALSRLYNLALEDDFTIDFDALEYVKGYRYGKLPKGGASYNFREEVWEVGVSLARIEGGEEIPSAMWYYERKEIEVFGWLLPMKGSDGEPLILAEGYENWDI